MQFNPDPNKQANEFIFSRKTISNNLSNPPIKFNNSDISKCPHQKHLGIALDSKLNFNAHVDQKIEKCNRIISLIRRLSMNLPRNALFTICKSFVRPHLDYVDILYDKPTMNVFRTNYKNFRIEPALQ